MAVRVLFLLVALGMAVLGLPARLAHAQGFFEQLFGGGQLPLPPPRPYLGDGRLGPYQSYGDGRHERAATYRTLCVRLCDGYYFPVSFSTTRAEFARDADRCAASCGGEARLFYHANPGGDVDTMVDLTGMGYADLPTAFKYRKTLVKGCACRPQPWSEAERERHRADHEGPVAARGEIEGGGAASAVAAEALAEPGGSAPADHAPARPAKPVPRYLLPTPQQSTFRRDAPREQGFSKRGSPASLFR